MYFLIDIGAHQTQIPEYDFIVVRIYYDLILTDIIRIDLIYTL